MLSQQDWCALHISCAFTFIVIFKNLLSSFAITNGHPQREAVVRGWGAQDILVQLPAEQHLFWAITHPEWVQDEQPLKTCVSPVAHFS